MSYDAQLRWQDLRDRMTGLGTELLRCHADIKAVFEDLRVYKVKIGTNAQIATHLDAKEVALGEPVGSITEAMIDDLEAAIVSANNIAKVMDGTTVTITAFLDDIRVFTP